MRKKIISYQREDIMIKITTTITVIASTKEEVIDTIKISNIKRDTRKIIHIPTIDLTITTKGNKYLCILLISQSLSNRACLQFNSNINSLIT